MKRLLLLLGATFFSLLMVYSQSKKIFEDELFYFEYPSSFKPSPIKNAPGMNLKLMSDSYGISISYIEMGWDESTNIWDNKISEQLCKAYSKNKYLVSKAKVTIQTKGGAFHGLKLLTNTQKQKLGKSYNLRYVSYLILHKGKLFIISFVSDGKYTKNSSTEYPEKLLKGFLFKGKDNVKEDFDKYLSNITRQLNSQCPIKVDECTTHMSVLLSGKTVMIKTIIDDSCEFLVDYNDFKSKMCENFSVALEKSFVQYLDRNGYTMMYMIYNEYDRLKKKVTISGHDILNYYH